MTENSDDSDDLEHDSVVGGGVGIVKHSPFYDHPNGLYRIAGGDRIYTHDELVEALEGDVTGLDFEEWAASYFQLRDAILAAGAAGIITIVGTDADG